MNIAHEIILELLESPSGSQVEIIPSLIPKLRDCPYIQVSGERASLLLKPGLYEYLSAVGVLDFLSEGALEKLGPPPIALVKKTLISRFFMKK